MARFSKAERQKIIREFALRHNGVYNPASFVEEVRRAGPTHPAYNWFTWDKDKAAFDHWVWQAREFAVGLRVRFKVEDVGRGGKIKIREREMPFLLSPVETRREGGGYYTVDPDSPEHMAEYCRQAAASLRSWLERYGGAVEYAGGSIKSMERQLAALEAATAKPTPKRKAA